MDVNFEIKSAGRILDILEYMTGMREAVSLAQIVRDLALPKSSTHGLVQTLAARGHVVQDGLGRYMLVEASRHGFPFRRHEEPLVVVAKPFMERLRDQSGETVILGTMNAHCDIRRLAKSVSHHPVRYDVNLDGAITAYCTATGRILLAHAPEQALEDYLSRVQFLSYTRFTVVEIQHIRLILEKARQDGYAINNQEFITGSTGISAPVFDGAGIVVASITLGTLTSRYIEKREPLILMLRTTADQISRSLGYRRSV